jgi:hypothetical protein
MLSFMSCKGMLSTFYYKVVLKGVIFSQPVYGHHALFFVLFSSFKYATAHLLWCSSINLSA